MIGTGRCPHPGDRPDFVPVVGGRRVGLEHRELTEEDQASNVPSLDWLGEALTAELRQRGSDRELDVAVSVNAAAPPFRKKRFAEKLLPVIADLVAARASTVPPGATVEVRGPELAKAGVVVVTSVHLSRVLGFLDGPLAFVRPSAWGPVGSSVVQVIRSKEKRLPAYATNPTLAEIWLLLVTGASWAQATDSALTRWSRVATAFQRVYLMDLRTRELQRVDDRAPASRSRG